MVDQHGTLDDHLLGPGEWGKIELVGVADVTDTPDLVADVAVSPDNQYAFLANWGEPDCAANSEAGGQGRRTREPGSSTSPTRPTRAR